MKNKRDLSWVILVSLVMESCFTLKPKSNTAIERAAEAFMGIANKQGVKAKLYYFDSDSTYTVKQNFESGVQIDIR